MRDYDREICICFHVPLGKIAKHVRLHRPPCASELAHCYGAGTGCGWCVPFLERIYEDVMAGGEAVAELSDEEFRKRRKEYHKKVGYEKKGGEGL